MSFLGTSGAWTYSLPAAGLAASSFVAVEVGLEHFSPASVILGRFLVAVVVLGSFALRETSGAPIRSIGRRDGLLLLSMGLTGAVGYNALLTTGQVRVDAFVASLLVNTAPIWVYLLAIAGGSERFSWRATGGALIGFTGASAAGATVADLSASWVGSVALLGAACCQAIYFVLLQAVAVRLGPAKASFLTVCVGTVLLAPFLPTLLDELANAGLRQVVSVLYLGSLPGAVGVLLWALAVRSNRATATAAALFLVPPLAALLAWCVLGESPSVLALGGGGLALAGVGVVTRATASEAADGPDASDTGCVLRHCQLQAGNRSVIDSTPGPRHRPESCADLPQCEESS